MTAQTRRFKQSDITRAIRGAVKAGLNVQSAQIDVLGRIVLNFGNDHKTRPANDWDVI